MGAAVGGGGGLSQLWVLCWAGSSRDWEGPRLAIRRTVDEPGVISLGWRLSVVGPPQGSAELCGVDVTTDALRMLRSSLGVTLGLDGYRVRRIDDDAAVPAIGEVIADLGGEWVAVRWGDDRRSQPFTEARDELTPWPGRQS